MEWSPVFGVDSVAMFTCTTYHVMSFDGVRVFFVSSSGPHVYIWTKIEVAEAKKKSYAPKQYGKYLLCDAHEMRVHIWLVQI